MPRLLAVLGIVMAILLVGCLPPVYTTATNFNPLPNPDDCVLLGTADPTTIIGDSIAAVTINGSVLWNSYTQQQKVDILRAMAHEKGANLVKVNLNIPGGRYSYGKINATFYKVKNVRQYETIIDWSPGRKLTLADFKEQGESGTQIQCGIYLLAGTNDASGSRYFGDFPNRYFTTLTRFYCRTSRIDPRIGSPDRQLIHEQGVFDLAELYRRQLERALSNTSNLHLSEWRKQSRVIYKQIYSAFLHTRAQYDAETNHGFDSARQAAWTKTIADATIPEVAVLSFNQLDAQAKSLVPPPDQSLVYVIRPNNYNTAVWKRFFIDPYYIITPYFLFINPDKFKVTCGNTKTLGPIDRRTFVYRLLPPGPCTFMPGWFYDGDDYANKRTLNLEPGKVYFIKMNIIEKDFLAGPEAQLKQLSNKQGERWLRKCKLSRSFEDFTQPRLPNPLNNSLPPVSLE